MLLNVVQISKHFLSRFVLFNGLQLMIVQRKIIHIDMDAFFASVEQLDNPELRGKPVAVGGSGPRSVVAAASYEARKYGVRSAMPSVTARKLCPGLIFVKHNFERYNEISARVHEIFRKYTDLIEPLSIDEAFLDVTSDRLSIGSATIIAELIRKEIKETTGLTASAGVSVNKFLAKIASDINKPDGMFVIRPEEAEKFIEKLDIEKFFGIGKVTAEKMHKLGIHKGKDLRKWDLPSLVRNFGKSGVFFHDIARGKDDRPVEPLSERKSIGTELTFEKDLTTGFEIVAELYKLEKELMERIESAGCTGKTVTLKIKFSDFRQITRSKTVHNYIRDFKTLHKEITSVRKALDLNNVKIRLLGVSISNLEDEEDTDRQLHLFDEY